ncbi:MerC domain-containing protein [Stratiformator vulcanicus]|uniref:MerC mercury resistance protein n=1 Tax=Stratiformator vulcanicus TaxID=2527980 RepID=A0A517QZ52_9PLAN|nr:MerC domain-containing protein [Stratiformator vulcanicus]QDT36912.1 MerC mercury resistance protein [Stratiformator vulcanicus]
MKTTYFNLDGLGMCASGLCMLHCLALPLLLTIAPIWELMQNEPLADQSTAAAVSISTEAPAEVERCCSTAACCTEVGGSTSAHETAGCCSSPSDFWFHTFMLATIVPLGLAAWGFGFRQHGDVRVLYLGASGTLLLLAALLFGHMLPLTRGEQAVNITGSIFLISAHVLNRHQCRCCREGLCSKAPQQVALTNLQVEHPATS